LKTALAATKWNGVAGTLPAYLTVTDSSRGATISIAATAGGSAVAIASITGATNLTYLTMLQHAIT
jgi:hypothetical protein